MLRSVSPGATGLLTPYVTAEVGMFSSGTCRVVFCCAWLLLSLMSLGKHCPMMKCATL